MAAGFELITMLTGRKLLVPGTATTAKKGPIAYVYCTKMLFRPGIALTNVDGVPILQ